jgi:hypothetical protein
MRFFIENPLLKYEHGQSYILARMNRIKVNVQSPSGEGWEFIIKSVSFLNPITPYMKMILPPLEKGDRGDFSGG